MQHYTLSHASGKYWSSKLNSGKDKWASIQIYLGAPFHYLLLFFSFRKLGTKRPHKWAYLLHLKLSHTAHYVPSSAEWSGFYAALPTLNDVSL